MTARQPMTKQEAGRLFWTVFGTIYIGGIVLHYLGARPQGGFSSEVIPVDEPTAVDWAQVFGILYFT
jgi:hypothetical protein